MSAVSVRPAGEPCGAVPATRRERTEKVKRQLSLQTYYSVQIDQGHPTVRFGEWEGLKNSLRYSNLLQSVKARGFHWRNITSTFRNKSTLILVPIIVFGGRNMSFRVQNKVS